MPDGIGEISIERSLEQIQQGIKDIGSASRSIDKDLRAVQAGLRLDPSNTELLAQKQELLSQKLENAKQRSQELSAAIAELNRLKQEQGYQTDGQIKLESTYTQQLKEAEIQVTALTGATQQQTETNKTAEESTKSFGKSMTEFQSNLRAVNQVMGGVVNTYKLLGGDPDSATGKLLQHTQEGIKIMTQFAGVGKLLKDQNILTAGSFGHLALSAGAALGAFSLMSGLIGGLNPDMQKTVGIVTAVAGVITAAAVATLAWKGVLTWGVGIPVMLAAVGAGIAGLKTAIGSATTPTEDISGTNIATPSVSAPSVPTYSGGGAAQSQTIVQTLSERQIEDAVYRSVTRSLIETGANIKQVTVVQEINGREFHRQTFNDLLAENAERGKPL